MITIRDAKHKPNGYDIILNPSTGRRSFYAKDLKEAIKAVNHYYLGEVHTEKTRNCPLCRKDK